MKFSISHLSRVGGRRSNQDRLGYAYTAESLLIVLADGMGGHPRGEVAAELAVRTFMDAYTTQTNGRFSQPPMFLNFAMRTAHQTIVRYAQEHRLPASPGTTCVACMVQDGCAWWAHAGDSRLYFVRDGEVLAKTRDHSVVARLLEMGEITELEAGFLERSVIYSCLGATQTPQVELSGKTVLRDGDTILLCSDGLWGPLQDGELAQGLGRGAPSEVLKRFMDLAQARAGARSDNLSAVLLKWDAGEPGFTVSPGDGAVVVTPGEND